MQVGWANPSIPPPVPSKKPTNPMLIIPLCVWQN
jgi:hypothetical protein